MDYKVRVSYDAKRDLDRTINYLVIVLRNKQAAKSLLSDYNKTINILSYSAGALTYCENPRLKYKGFKRINLCNHKYFLIFHIEKDVVVIDKMFHFLQDYEGKIR